MTARDEYAARLASAEGERTELTRREAWLANGRLATAAVFVAIAWFSFGTRAIGAAWLLVPTAVFAGLALLHDRATRRRELAESRIGFYTWGRKRLDEEWRGEGKAGLEHLPAQHLYADDLDLFGTGSLFEKLCTARTPGGEAALARWLCEASGLDAICERQQAVQELTPRLDLRERLATAGERSAHRMRPERLQRWGEAPITLRGRWPRLLALTLSASTIAAIAGWIWLGTGFAPIAALVIAQIAFASLFHRRAAAVLAATEAPTRDLALFAQILTVIEAERFETPALSHLRAQLDTHGLAPSEAVARLRRLSDLLDARRNQLFAPLAALLLWGTQLAFALEGWREQHGAALGPWIAAVGEFEALCSIAGYAYENPQDPYPTLVPEGPVFDGRKLGHPLLPSERCVPNDLELGRTRRAFVMSGSNMSGKSTMLRTVGTNAVLAMLGAPVRAQALTMSPLRIGASLQVRDSLQHGISHFYAELVRLRDVVELARPDPTGRTTGLLFLLDEILHGTNSHDRRIGAEAVIRGLVERGAIGIATTHDLALSEMADARPGGDRPGPGEKIENVHFADTVVDGAMHFDYELKPGVVHGSNALALMRAVGLEV